MTPEILTFWEAQGWSYQQIGVYACGLFQALLEEKTPAQAHALACREVGPPPTQRVVGPTVRNLHYVWSEYAKRVEGAGDLTNHRAETIKGCFRLWEKYDEDPLEAILYQIRGALSQDPGLERFGVNAKRTDPEWVFGGKITRCRALRTIGLAVETFLDKQPKEEA